MTFTFFICRFKQPRPKSFVYFYGCTNNLAGEVIYFHGITYLIPTPFTAEPETFFHWAVSPAQ